MIARSRPHDEGRAALSPHPTLGASLRGTDNALNFLRLLLAAAVIVSHTPLVAGYNVPPPFGDGQIGRWAVNGFFAISGYLIAASRLRLELRPYLWRRFLRIMPAYWGALVVTAFAIAPLSALISAERYEFGGAAGYVGANALLLQLRGGIDNTLLAVPLPGRWNISLWTLYYEFAAYVIAGALLSSAAIRRHLGVFSGCLLAGLVASLPIMSESADPVRLLSYFVAGMALCAVRDRLPVRGVLALASAMSLCVLQAAGVGDLAAQLPFAYTLLYLGAVLRTRIGAKNDLSYGVYIYAFPMQQFLVVVGGARFGFVGFTLAASMMTLPLAAVSWRLVERPAMLLRSLVPDSSRNVVGRAVASERS